MELTVVIRKEGKLFSAWAADLDIASQGKTIEEAMKNIKEAVELYMEDEDAKVKTEDVLIYPLRVKDAEVSASAC
ncbi:MAG: type II toxin-antitoxin system HicB family antitoxin [Candidatus Altiarchaeia archaeon]